MKERNPEGRYATYDFCYNYFNNFKNKKEIANNKNLEVSCLYLWYYLSSWGMVRAKSNLIKHSIKVIEPIIKSIAEMKNEIWNLDVENYDNDSIEKLRNCYNTLLESSNKITNKNKVTLITKIMLGVFGCVPAYDRNFKKGMQKLVKDYNIKCGFTSFNKKSLESIKIFYIHHKKYIDNKSDNLWTLNFGNNKSLNKYKRAKIIDMIGFKKGE